MESTKEKVLYSTIAIVLSNDNITNMYSDNKSPKVFFYVTFQNA